MISVMSSELESSSDRNDAEVEQGRGVPPSLDDGNDTTGRFGRHSVFYTEEATRVSLADSNKSNETGVSCARNEDRVSEVKKEEETSVDVGSVEALENRPSSSFSETETNSNGTDLQDVKLVNKKKLRGVVEDYDSILSDFDEFAANDNGGDVGYGYEVGDMVWGKVKSHPWWPGHIYNEKYASVSVRKSKREGHVLVAFFGDSSYGWFLPAELVPFEQNFTEKSRQTNLRSFSIAVEEAMDELSRRRSLGLACRCRNEFNFWPSAFEGEYLVDIGVGDEPGIYSSIQINKARHAFQPREMLAFMQQLAVKPRNQHLTIEFIKNKATALACRKSLFEEFDETYAQAFGTTPERPQRPNAPMTLDPSKAPLSGRLVVAEGLSKQNNSVKPTKVKYQMDDKYQFKRRDEHTPKKPKKLLVGQAGITSNPHLVDGSGVSERAVYSGIGDNMHQNHESACVDGQHQPMRYSTSVVSGIKPSECPEKLFSSATKKVKIRKQPLVNLGSEHTDLVGKKKKKIKKEISTKACSGFVQLPVALTDGGVTVEKVSGTQALHVPTVDDNCQIDFGKDSVVGSNSSLVEAQLDTRNIELLMLLKDLCALALNPFHGMDRSCPGNVLSVFLKFRSLVYQKSLVLAPTESDEASEARASKLLSTDNVLVVPVDGTNDTSMKPVKSSGRPADSTKSGKKRGLLDHPEGIKKKIRIGDSQDLKRKRFHDLEEVKRRKVHDLEIIKKKMVGDLDDKTKPKKINELEDIKKKRKSEDGKLFAVEKKQLERHVESQRTEAKEVTAKNVSPTLKAALLESSKKKEQSGRVPNPTMLVMKFPSGAGLPSGAELRARFARFGPMDHSATRIFWKSYTCRLVYRYMADAEAALKFVNSSGNLFGSTNVRCYLRDVLAEAAEAESAKIQREDLSTVGTSHSRDPSLEQRIASAQVTQQSGQLKSCLKKPSIDEGGNGVGRGSRVKFVLDGEESSNNKQLFSGNKNVDNYVASFPEADSSPSYSVDVNSKNLSKFVVPPPPTPFHKLPINMTEQASAGLYPPHTRPHLNNDISQEMLNLLNKCSEVVSNLTRVLGYVPYRAL